MKPLVDDARSNAVERPWRVEDGRVVLLAYRYRHRDALYFPPLPSSSPHLGETDVVEASRYKPPFQHVKKYVLPVREDHAEKERECLKVHRAISLFRRDGTDRHHQRRTGERNAGAIKS